MASAPSNGSPASGRVDRDGRLVAADPPLERLQRAAGSALGRPLAIPQLASLARSAQTLVVPLSRAVLAADDGHDLDLWVRAEPDADGVTLIIERWASRAAAPPRLALAPSGEPVAEDPAAVEQPLTWACDARLHLTELSPRLADLLGAGDAAIGQPLTRLFRLVEEEDGTMPLLAALAAQSDLAGQRAAARHGADEAELTLSAQPLHDADGRFAGFDGRAIAPESTTPSGAPAEMPAIDVALDEALRSPLDRIIASADRIVERSDGPLRSDYASYASDIAAAGRHLLSVIRSMSEDSGGDAGHSVDVAAVVEEAAGLVQPAAAARQVDVEIDRPELRTLARGEPRAVVQILVNILGNAIRHSPAGGTVAVVFDYEEGRVAITIADQGPGIARADQQRIFERYERLGDTAEGAGLGLAISRRLAQSMGGDIRLDSARGEGARFTLLLPSP